MWVVVVAITPPPPKHRNMAQQPYSTQRALIFASNIWPICNWLLETTLLCYFVCPAIVVVALFFTLFNATKAIMRSPKFNELSSTKLLSLRFVPLFVCMKYIYTHNTLYVLPI